jgi:hypothetical protein
MLDNNHSPIRLCIVKLEAEQSAAETTADDQHSAWFTRIAISAHGIRTVGSWQSAI